MHDRIRDVLPMGADIDVRNVYGIEGYVTRGILFAASQDGDLLVRLDPESRMEALELSGATTWSPSDDAESYVIIPNYLLNSDETLRFWVTRALEYAEAQGIDGDDDDMEMEPYDEYERSPQGEAPMDVNGAAHDDGDDEMEGEEVRLPPPAPRPKAPKPVRPAAPAPAAAPEPVAAAAPKPAAKKPAAKKAAPAKAKAAPKKKAAAGKAKPAAKKAAPKKGAAKKAKAAPKKKAAKKPVKKAAAKKAKAAPKKKAAVKKAKPAAKKPVKKAKAAPKKKASKKGKKR